MNKEVMFCYYHVLSLSGVSAFRKLMHQLWSQCNLSLADEKRYLLAFGKLTESGLEEITCEAAQLGWKTRIRFVISAMTTDHSRVQTLGVLQTVGWSFGCNDFHRWFGNTLYAYGQDGAWYTFSETCRVNDARGSWLCGLFGKWPCCLASHSLWRLLIYKR